MDNVYFWNILSTGSVSAYTFTVEELNQLLQEQGIIDAELKAFQVI